MESGALVEIFKASETFNQLRYVEFLGDGDTKSHRVVVVADPYPGAVVKKLECIGHVHKRVGSRLRKLKASYKGTRTIRRRTIRRWQSSHKQINKLQNYYGIAVRQYTGSSVYELKKSIGAVLYHRSEADSDEQQHEMYPRDPNTWWTFHADIANNTSFYKKSGSLLPKAVKKIIKPIFMNLSDNEHLEKCLHGKTQNNNESFKRNDMEEMHKRCVCWEMCMLGNVYVGKCVCWEMCFLGDVYVGKCVCWEMCMLGNVFLGRCVCWEMCMLGNVYVGKCVCWEMCFLGDVYVGKCVCWEMCMLGNVYVGKCVCWEMCFRNGCFFCIDLF